MLDPIVSFDLNVWDNFGTESKRQSIVALVGKPLSFESYVVF